MSQHSAVVEAIIGGVRALGVDSGGTHASFRIHRVKQIAGGMAFVYDPDPLQMERCLHRSRRESTSGTIIEPAATSAPG